MIDLKYIFLIIIALIVPQFFLYLKFCINNKINLINDFYNRKKIVNSAGIVFIANFILYLLFLNFFNNEFIDINKHIPKIIAIYLSVFVLGAICLMDDLKSIDFRIRICIQFVCVFASLSLIQIPSEIYNFIPMKILQISMIFLWIYLINIHNFLDGVDGMLTINTIFISSIIILESFFSNKIYFSTILSIFLLGSCLSFLFFNFPKAKLFLGDTGSIFLGYIIGLIFLENIFYQNFFLAFSIIFYVFIDMTLTLSKKIIKGKKPWDRLFDYFFLIPIIKQKLPHSFSTTPFIIYNIILVLTFVLFKITNLNFLFIINIISLYILLNYYTNVRKKS